MTKTEKGAKKRGEIVDRVILRLNRLDLSQATVRGICAAAEISVGTFYHYFPEKGDLINSILCRIDNALTGELAPQLTHRDELENLMLFGLFFARYTEKVGSAAGGVISSSGVPLPHTPGALSAERSRPLYTIPCEILRRGRKKGQVSPELNVEETVDLLLISLRGQSLEWARRNYSYSIEEKTERFMRLFVRALRV